MRGTEQGYGSHRNVVHLREKVMDTFQKRFVPQADITTHELASIVGNLPLGGQSEWTTLSRGIWFTHETWDALPDNIKRHFV